MKITRQQLAQIINEETAAVVSELEKPGFLKRMGGMVGLGYRKEAHSEVLALIKKWEAWRDSLLSEVDPDLNVTFDGEFIDQDRKTTVAVERLFLDKAKEYEKISTEMQTLFTKLGAKGMMPDSKQAAKLRRKILDDGLNSMRAFSSSLGRDARKAAQSLDADAKKMAEKIAAAELKAKWDAAGEKVDAEREEKRRIKDAEARAKDRANPMSGGWWGSTGEHPGSSATVAHGARGGGRQGTLKRENNKLTLTDLQQIVQEEIVKLNEEK